MKIFNLQIALCLVAGAGLISCAAGHDAQAFNVDEALNYCDSKVNKCLASMGSNADYTMMPRNIEGADSVWHCRKAMAEEWCSGFWPGILWFDYENTKNAKVRDEAEKFTASLEHVAHEPAYDHDLGFVMFCSYGNGYRLTGKPEYKQVILATADSLATLFNDKVGTILSWPRNVELYGGHNTIMDNMMNLEILFWASKNGGDRRLHDIAVKHAETTMANHFRPDGTCYHVAVYDPETGEFLKGVTHQGYADGSTWARGQAWAIYGYTMVYRETKDPKFLDFACKVADVYLNRLPEDKVPYWDFDDPAIPQSPRDASAASIVASALLELQGYCTDSHHDSYLADATRMLRSLSSDSYRSAGNKVSFLDHSTGHKPAGTEVDASIIYADYYYMEALMKYKKLLDNETERVSGADAALAHLVGGMR